MGIKQQLKRVKCPFCGYEMPVYFDPLWSKCRGVYIQCKGRGCKRRFEININTDSVK
nr:MAG TPA: cysteine-rich protein [Caudoviricetes sp.]